MKIARFLCRSMRYSLLASTNLHHSSFISSPILHRRCFSCEPNSLSKDAALPQSEIKPNESLNRLASFVSDDNFDIEVWQTLISDLCQQLRSFQNHEIEAMVDYLNTMSKDKRKCSSFSFFHDESVSKLAKCLAKELCERAPELNNAEFLKVFRYFRTIPMPKRTEFAPYVVKKKLRPILKGKNKEHIIEFLSLMNYYDIWKVYHVDKYRMELLLHHSLNELSVAELTTVLMTLTCLRIIINTPNLMERICSKITEELPNINSPELSAIAKFLYIQLYDCRHDSIVILPQLVNLSKGDNFSYKSMMHLAEVCNSTRYYDPEFFEILGNRLLERLPDVPMTDIKTTLRSITYFDSNLKFESFYNSFLQIVRNSSRNQLLLHPKAFIHVLNSLSNAGVYPYDLVDIVFSPAFLSQTYGKSLKRTFAKKDHIAGDELVIIEGGLRMECPDYEGNRLDAETFFRIRNYACWALPSLLQITKPEDQNSVKPTLLLRSKLGDSNFSMIYSWTSLNTRIIYDVRLVLFEILGGEEFLHTGYLLPHLLRPNLIFALDEQGVPQRLPKSVTGNLIVDTDLLDTKLRWLTISVLFQNRNKEKDEPLIVGNEIAKVRQLKKLNFNVIKVVIEEWGQTIDERKDYLRKKIFGV